MIINLSLIYFSIEILGFFNNVLPFIYTYILHSLDLVGTRSFILEPQGWLLRHQCLLY